MPSSFNKFNLTVQDWLDGAVNYASDTFKVLLTDTVPQPANHVYADIANELNTGGGYVRGGAVVTMSQSNLAGVETIVVTIPTPTWSGVFGGFGPCRYAVFYDTNGIGSLQAWFDLGVEVQLGNGNFLDLVPAASFFTLS